MFDSLITAPWGVVQLAIRSAANNGKMIFDIKILGSY
jgi:hypothetical protein